MQDAYPPLRDWLDKARADIEVLRTMLENMEQRLDLYEKIMHAVLSQKEGHHDH